MALLSDLFQQLSLSDDKITVLTQIRTVISSASNDEIWSVVSRQPLAGIFENISADDSDQLETCCAILDRLFGALDTSVLLTTFNNELLLGLSHRSPAVNEISLNQVIRVASANAQQLATHVHILQKVAHLIGHENGNISSKASKVFVILAQSTEGLAMIFHSQVLSEVLQLMSKGDSIQFRVYEMVVDVAMVSQEALMRCFESTLLQSLVIELNRTDVLIQLNCLELLSKLSLCHHGFQYLETTGIISRVEQLLLMCEQDALTATLLQPGILKFFGGLCHIRPKEMCVRLVLFMMKVFEALNSSRSEESEIADIAMESIGLIGNSPDGKMALQKYSDQMAQVCRYLGQQLSDSPSSRRSRVLDVIAQLMYLKVESQTTELLALTKEWFDLLLELDPLKKILGIAKQPFLELHVPGLEVIKSLAQLPWAQEYLNSQPGFEEYLLDRSTEKTKEGMEKKYEIVRTLLKSPTTSSVFSNESILRLRTYESQGPFYVEMQTVVAFEST